IILTKAGNPVKKILLKLNLSDHMSILTDLQLSYRFITRCSCPTIKYKDIIFQDFRYSDTITSSSDSSLYDSFIFDLSINPFPPADRSDFYHEEFADELAHIISPSEYDCFCFKNEPNSRNSLWMWWRILFQQQNQEFICIMFYPPIPPFN
nr:hypothetical protein [Tanacetum cinerariifolium]